MATKTPIEPPIKPTEKTDRFHAEMPHIPGLANAGTGASSRKTKGHGNLPAKIGGLAAVAFLVVIAFIWHAKSGAQRAAAEKSALDEADLPAVLPATPPPPALDSNGPTLAATAEELSKPWSAKKFLYVRPSSQEKIDAIVIRLPGNALWAFALQEPFGRCNLEFVTDLGKLSKQYGFRSSHPMVVSPCTNAVYDPLKLASLSDRVWVRGEIVRGQGLRPPFSIEVLEKGSSIIADRME